MAERLCQSCKERVQQVRHDESNNERVTGGQAARHHVGLVIEFLDACQDTLTSCLADIGIAAQCFRYSNNGHIQFARYVLETNSHRCSVRRTVSAAIGEV